MVPPSSPPRVASGRNGHSFNRFPISRRVQKHLREFCESTSVPGLKYLAEPKRSLPERALWIGGITLALVACAMLTQQTWTRWRTSPVIVAMDEKMKPVWDIPFPAVTICPLSRVRLDCFNITDILRRLKESKTIQDGERDTFFYLMVLCDDIIEFGFKNLDVKVIDMIEEYALERDAVIDKTIKFRGRYTNNTRFSPLMTTSGLCYSFNMLPAKDLFSDDTFHASRNYLLYPKANVQWTLGGGYISSAAMNAYPYRALSAGKKSGLFLKLKTEDIHLEYYCTQSIQGFEVLLHNPAQFPRMSQQSFLVPFKTSTRVSVTPLQMTTDPDVRTRYSPLQRQCYFPDERQLRFFKVYTQSNCELECISNFSTRVCGCAPFYTPRLKDTPMCGKKSHKCLNEASVRYSKVQSGLIDDSGEEVANDKREIRACDCMQSCTNIRYQVERSRTSYESTKLEAFLHNGSENKIQVAELIIYFRDTYFIPTRRMELYGAVSFIANCGGVLGLCLGMSVLSILELLYWLLVRPLSGLRRVTPATAVVPSSVAISVYPKTVPLPRLYFY